MEIGNWFPDLNSRINEHSWRWRSRSFLSKFFVEKKGLKVWDSLWSRLKSFQKILGRKRLVVPSLNEYLDRWLQEYWILAWKVSKKRNLRRKVWFWGWTFAQWLNNFWKGKFVVGRKLGRGNYGIHNVNFSVIFLVICMQQMISEILFIIIRSFISLPFTIGNYSLQEFMEWKLQMSYLKFIESIAFV